MAGSCEKSRNGPMSVLPFSQQCLVSLKKVIMVVIISSWIKSPGSQKSAVWRRDFQLYMTYFIFVLIYLFLFCMLDWFWQNTSKFIGFCCFTCKFTEKLKSRWAWGYIQGSIYFFQQKWTLPGKDEMFLSLKSISTIY